MNQVTVSQDLLLSMKMSRGDFLIEVGLMLYQREKLTLWQAARLSELKLPRFLALLESRGIPYQLGDEELEEDVATLSRLGLI